MGRQECEQSVTERQLKAKIAIGRKQLEKRGLDEETYRAMLEEVAGRRSLSGHVPEAVLARVVDHLAAKGAVFAFGRSSGRKHATAAKPPALGPDAQGSHTLASADGHKEGSVDTPYKAKAAGRRTDFYEIPDGKFAPLKRRIAATWKDLGYALYKLDTRTQRETGVEAFRWCNDGQFLKRLMIDLEKRLKRKEEKARVAV